MVSPFNARIEALYHRVDHRRRASAMSLIALLTLVITMLMHAILAASAIQSGDQRTLILLAVSLVLHLGLSGAGLALLFNRALRDGSRLQAIAYWITSVAILVLPLDIAGGVAGSLLFVYVVSAATFLDDREIGVMTLAEIGALGLVLGLRLTGILPIDMISPAGLAARQALFAVTLLMVGFALSRIIGEMASQASANQVRADRLQTLVEFSYLSGASTSINDQLGSMVKTIRERFNFERVQLHTLDESQGRIQLRASTDIHPPVVRVDLPVGPRSLVGQAIIRRRAVTAAELDPTLAVSAGSAYQIALPVIRGPRILGVLELVARDERLFDSHNRIILDALVGQVGSALEVVQVLASEAATLENASPLFKATQALSAATSLDQILAHLQTHLMPDLDHLSLVQASQTVPGEIEIHTIRTLDANPQAAHLIEGLAPQIVNVERPVLVVDLAMTDFNPALTDALRRTLGAVSMAIYPLYGQDLFAGTLLLISRRPREFTEAEQQAMRILSGQIGVILQNAALIETLSSQTEVLGVINSLSRALAERSNFEEIGEAIRDHINFLMEPRYLGLALANPTRTSAEVLNLRGRSLPTQLDIRRGPLEQALSMGLPRHLQMPTGWPEAVEWFEMQVDQIVVAPLIARTRPIGALIIGFEAMDTVNAERISTIQQVADELASRLDNVSLLAQLQRSLEESTALYATSLAMNAAQTLPEVYDTALTEMQALCGAQQLELYLAGPDPRRAVEYVEIAARLIDGELDTGESTRFRLDEAPVLSQFPQSRANLMFNNISDDQRLDGVLRAQMAARGYNALMLIPISTGQTWLGAVLLYGQAGQVFSSDQVRLCRNVADQAALAVDSQMLLTRTRLSALREASLREITEKIRAAQSVEQIEAIALAESQRVLESSFESLESTHMEDRAALSEEDQAFLEGLGIQMDLAIANLRLQDNAERNSRRDRLMGEITSRLQRAQTVDEVLSAAAGSLQSLLDRYDVRVRLDRPEDSAGLQTGQLAPGDSE